MPYSEQFLYFANVGNSQKCQGSKSYILAMEVGKVFCNLHEGQKSNLFFAILAATQGIGVSHNFCWSNFREILVNLNV